MFAWNYLQKLKRNNFKTLKQKKRSLLLINTSPAYSLKGIADLKKIEGVSEVYPLRGMYDIIAVAEAESFEKLKEIVFNESKIYPTSEPL